MTMTVLGVARRLAAVRFGMRVIDRAGAPVGTVCAVKPADPLAVDATGQRIGQSSDMARLLPGYAVPGEPRAASPVIAARLVQHGYLKIDGRYHNQADRYALADEIQDVTDGIVTLSVPRDALTARR